MNRYSEPEVAGQCRSCAGPCLTFKGSAHRWTCTACLDRYIADSVARAEAREAAELERRARKATRVWEQAPSLEKRSFLGAR
ncbi:hypothetical protein M1247_07125 [Mycobacterium sp. 21AC1]|uniref:hypothetical protein n=1 Tax=[Mycobacterium] appelbergii TaxID=2939269 RepID=UPI002938FF68|nr:hypothetical protein [Mycobacterium sp. 21AC1]MDV3124680.1 hypothetical protein [Mycobacterium sp. 21AC1]